MSIVDSSLLFTDPITKGIDWVSNGPLNLLISKKTGLYLVD